MSSDASASHEMRRASAGIARRQRFVLWLVAAVILIATVFSYLGTADSWVSTPPEPEPEAEPKIATMLAPVVAADPARDIELPAGPHRDEFQSSCLICHSARLPLSQPPFGRQKWAEIVHKMADAYGAPVSADDEARIVQYLLAVRPPRS
jgi:hypothetical protein